MPKHIPCKPTCPKCEYDLSGSEWIDTTLNCPECGNPCTESQATTIISHWNRVKLSMLWLGGVPLILSGFSFVFLLTWSYEDDIKFIFGFVPLGISIYICFIAMFIAVIKDVNPKFNDAINRPKRRISTPLILLSYLIGCTVSIIVFGMWGEAIAGV